ncbi:hypothetical protein [Arenibaculum pallidiluteum]|uniref:hypothetical protein n=1 Tax=Arenibaculum pallidiluteum TaxID=2812559 RepID=UPI001A95E81A|nr:hypothetical protein [Arenibaculum pallidiluteum]
MSWIVTWTFVAQALLLILGGLTRPHRIYEYPFLAGAMAVSFILPQLPAMIDNRFLPAGAYEMTVCFTILCFAMIRLGWSDTAPALRSFRWTLDEGRLLLGAAALSAAGAVFYFELSRRSGELAVMTGMTGVPVMQLFFSKLLPYGMGIALLCLMRRPSLPALAIVAFDALLYLDRIFVTGKRGETVELVLMVALATFFHRDRTLPRLLVVAGVVAGTLVMESVAEYRDITRTKGRPELADIAEIPVMENFAKGLEKGGLEMPNALILINAADRDMQLDFGAWHWNIFVFNYFPAQLLGQDLKQQLMLDIPRPGPSEYNPVYGTTETGMADAFRSFWWFGAVKFLLISHLLCRVWQAARQGWAVPQIIYMFSAAPAMNAISHHTQWVPSTWLHMALFMLPVLWFARCPAPRGGAAPNPRPAAGSLGTAARPG